MSVCLFLHTYVIIILYFVYVSIYLSIYLSVYLPVCVSVYVSVGVSIHLSVLADTSHLNLFPLLQRRKRTHGLHYGNQLKMQ